MYSFSLSQYITFVYNKDINDSIYPADRLGEQKGRDLSQGFIILLC